MLNQRRFRSPMEATCLRLEIGVRLRDPLVLAQVLGPGFDEEPLGDVLRIGRILGDAPRIGTIAPPLL